MKRYPCHFCRKIENEHDGSWNETPYLFFCSEKCHTKWENLVHQYGHCGYCYDRKPMETNPEDPESFSCESPYHQQTMINWEAFWYFFNTYYNHTETKMSGVLGNTVTWDTQKHIIEFLIEFLYPHLIIDMKEIWDTVYNVDSKEWEMQQKDIENAVEKQLAKSKPMKSRVLYIKPYFEDIYGTWDKVP